MIYLYTATPGTGKTCWVVKQLVDKWIDDPANADRKIYSNIAGLKIEGIHELPDDFRECDDGSILIYDEPQDIEHYCYDFRGKNEIVKALSKHRHRGFDIHMISQDPALLHKFVLKNVYMHYYLWRPAQRNNVEIFTFARSIVTPTPKDLKNAYDKKWWRFEKHYLQYYKSTVINTSKKESSSKKIGILFTSLVVFSCIFYGIFNYVFSARKEQEKIESNRTGKTQQQKRQKNKETEKKSRAKSNSQQQDDQQLTKKMLSKYVAETAYNEDIRVAGVMMMGSTCNAVNSYGERLNIPNDDCIKMIKNRGSVVRKRTQKNEKKFIQKNPEEQVKSYSKQITPDYLQ